MKIRDVKKNDLNDLFKLEKKIFSYDQISYRSFWWMINGANRIFLVVEMDKKIIGYGLVLRRSNSLVARLYSLAIDHDYRGRGIAKKILKNIFSKLKKNNCNKLSLEVKQENTQAIRLYKKNGFTLVGTKKKYYSDKTTALCYEKKI